MDSAASEFRTRLPYLRAYAPALAIGLVAMAACGAAAGLTLGFFLGAVFLAALIAPALAAGQERLLDRALAVGGVADAIALATLVALFAGRLSFIQWLEAYVLVVACVAALGAATHLLATLRLDRWLAAGVVMFAAMLWLLWPVWLAPVLTERLADWLTPCHPLFALNGLLRHLGLWSEQAGVAYHLTNLNQDIPHRLPDSPWPAIAAHLLLAAMALVLAWTVPPKQELEEERG